MGGMDGEARVFHRHGNTDFQGKVLRLGSRSHTVYLT